MKKIIALILVLTMIFAFASCTLFGGNDDDNDSGNNDDKGNDSGDNGDLPFGGIDLPLVDIEPDGIE